MDEKQIFDAYLFWYRNYEHKFIDEWIRPFITKQISPIEGGCLRKTRQALLLSTGKMAEKLKISRTAYAKFEKNEATGSIKIKTLSEIAEAMDCELVYALRSKKNLRFSQIVWQKLMPSSVNHHWVKTRSHKMKPNALAHVAQLTLNDPEFRQQKGWSERRTPK